MPRAVIVLLIIAIVGSVVQSASLVVDYVTPSVMDYDDQSQNSAARAELRWKVYWFTGVAFAVVGYLARRRFEVAGLAWFVSGVYLMLLGNNAGVWASGYVEPRLVTSILTLLALTAVVWKES